MARPELRMTFADADALGREFESNLRLGRAFLPGASGVEVLSDCTLVLVHPADANELALPAQVVMVSDSPGFSGVGIELRPFDGNARERIASFVRGGREGSPSVTAAVAEAPAVTESVAVTETESAAETDADAVSSSATDSDSDSDASADADEDADPDSASDADSEPETEDEDGDGDEGETEEPDVQAQAAIMERMRSLSQVERQKLARRGELQERVLLERLYEKEVWNLLLHNPRITLPEIARIARKRSVPRNLLEQIVDNAAWIQTSLVRRALLGNPRIGPDSIQKLIRATPRHELKMMAKSTGYSLAVRDAARKALKPPT